MSLSPAQLAQRLEGITATDVSAIVGVNPYRSRIDVWREKRGEAPPWIDTNSSRLGEWIEPYARRDYAERHGMRIDVPGTLVHPDRAWMMSTPDGVCYRVGSADPERGLEIKRHGWRFAHLYGAPGSDEVPLWELCQCAWNIGVTGLARWDLLTVIEDSLTEYVIDRDEELVEQLVEQCDRFRVDNIIGGAMPDPDGSESFDAWLKSKWERNPGALVDIGDDNDTFTLIERGRAIREQQADLDRELGKLIQELKLKIADAEGLTWKNANGKPEKLTWKRNKSGRRVDHAGMAGDMRADARLTLSGMSAVIDRASICLAAAGHATVGSSTRAAIDAAELHDLVAKLSGALATIAGRTDDKYTTETPGNRPLCWPRTWKAPTEKKEQ